MKRIELTTPTGRIATLDVDIEKFKGLPVEVFLTEYVDRYDRAFSTISRQRIIDALRELWKLEYEPDDDDGDDIEETHDPDESHDDDNDGDDNHDDDPKPKKKVRKSSV